jgi:hypothetical protein
VAAWNDAPAAGGLGECAALVRSAEALRFSAPELAVQLARRALEVGAESAKTADVGQAKSLSMRAQAVLAAGLARMSHYSDAVEPGFAALALAESEGVTDVAVAVRLDLATCSREVGEPLLGCALLRPVLEATQPDPSVRAIALGRLVGCIAHVGRRDDLEDALAEADRVLSADDGLGPDARRMERARLSVRAAAYYRWYGDTEDAAEAAREGLTQLNRLRGLRAETARLRAQLVLELACALLDDGSLAEAASVSEAVLAEPVRATSAAAVGRLMLAVSTRVHLPSGRVERGRGLLDQAVWVADRHGLDDLLADALTAVSQLDEKAGRTAEALESLHAARAAEQRRLRGMSLAARRLLTETNPAKWNVRTVNALLRKVIRGAPAPQAATGATPAHDDWRIAAQRVTQPRQQATQSRAVPALPSMGQSTEDRAWPTEQPTTTQPADRPTPPAETDTTTVLDSPRFGRPPAATQPASTPLDDHLAAPPSSAHPKADLSSERRPATHAGDRQAGDPISERAPANHTGDRPANPPLGEHAPAAQPGNRPAGDPTGERTAAAHGDHSAGAGISERPAAAHAGDRLTGDPSGERPTVPQTSDRLPGDPTGEHTPATRAGDRPAGDPFGERPTVPQTSGWPLGDPTGERAVAAHAGDRPAADSVGERTAVTPVGDWSLGDPTGERAAAFGGDRAASGSAGERTAAPGGSPSAGDLVGGQSAATRAGEPPAAALSGEQAGAAADERPVVPSWSASELAALWPGGQASKGAATPVGEQAAARADKEEAGVRSGAAAAEPDLDAATGLLSKEGLIRRLSAVRNGDRPVALTLVRLEGQPGPGRFAPGTRPAAAAEFELSELAGRVRTIAPDNAELARSDGMELAVLLPRTTRDQAEKFAAEVESAWLRDANGQNISTGVVQSNPEATTVDAHALINEARHVLAPSVAEAERVPPSVPRTVEDLAKVDDDAGDTLRIGREIIRSLSISEGSGGKRRAADAPPADVRADTAASDEPGGTAREAQLSPTYEQTRADLVRMMSALNTETNKESTPPPAPASPTEDTTRNGTTLPRQSIPTPPDPDEIPEPQPRPDVPEPEEPQPIPPAPPEPGPDSPGDPGPLRPPSAADPDSAAPAGSAASAERGSPMRLPSSELSAADRSGGTPASERKSPTSLPSDEPDRAAGADVDGRGSLSSAERGRADGIERGPVTSQLNDGRGSAGGADVGERRSLFADDRARFDGSDVRGRRSMRSLFSADRDRADGTDAGEPGPLTSLPNDERRWSGGGDAGGRDSLRSGDEGSAALPDRAGNAAAEERLHNSDPAGPVQAGGMWPRSAESDTSGGSDASTVRDTTNSLPRRERRRVGESPRLGGERDGRPRAGRLADAFREEPAGRTENGPRDLGAAFGSRNAKTGEPGKPSGRTTERRAERSSGSTTIAGLLAEALAAYQESPEELEPPAKKEQAPDNDFDRLFDWRYQSPASGRHRSPE